MRLRTTALVPLLAALVLTACGGGGGGADGVASLGGDGKDGKDDTTSTTLSEEEAQDAMIDWAACMREHGVDMPDPQVDANGRGVIIGRAEADDDSDDGAQSTPPDRDAFEAAQKECGDPPMLGRELTEEDRKDMQEQALKFAECMRDNGIEDFPDPDFSQDGPGAGPGTKVERFNDDDDAAADGESHTVVAGPFGTIDLDDAATKAAFETCQKDVGFGPGGKGGPPVAVATAPKS